MGGQPDGEGFIDAQKLIRIIKDEFEMTIDIEKLIADIDEDGSGEIEYDEFRNLLSSSDWVVETDKLLGFKHSLCIPKDGPHICIKVNICDSLTKWKLVNQKYTN